MGLFSKLFSTKSSFSKKMTLYIVVMTAALFAVAIVIVSITSSNLIRKEAQSKAFSILKSTNQEIENVLKQVSVAVDNIAIDVINAATSTDGDYEKVLYGLTKRLVENNDHILGSCIAFEPYSYKEYKFFAPYSFYNQKSDSISTLQTGNENYDYQFMDWYQLPKLLKRSYWTDPFFDEGGGDIVMCTYTHPLFRKDGTFMGVVTADLNIKWFTKMVTGIQTYDNAYNVMIGKGGAFIVHPNSEKIMNETFFSAAIGRSDTTLYHVGREMIKGNTGMATTNIQGVKSFLFYSPIPSSGWSVAIVCPYRDVYSGVSRMSLILVLVGVFGIALLFFVTRSIISNLTKPLSEFATSARSIANGDFATKLPIIKTDDEMKELYNSFDYMQNSLTSYIAELKSTTSAKEKIESELNIAREIQMGMIPKIFPPFPDRHDLDIYAMLRPAREVGGDLYDFFIDSGKLFFAVGDVSGKGVPASLLMAVTRSLFRSVATTIGDPMNIVKSMNSAISETNESNMFVTLFIAELDLSSGKLRYCNAGHNPPVLVSGNKNNRKVKFLELDPNVPIGLFEGFDYTLQETHIDLGTSLFLYTDGLTEAENEDKVLYGEDALINVLKGVPNLSAKDMLNLVFDSVETHVNGAVQSDDLTMLVIEYRDLESDGNHKVLVMKNEVAELNRLVKFVDKISEENDFSPTLAMNLNLVLEEAVSNVIFYAYPKGESHHTLQLDFDRDGDEISFVLLDHGSPFDPTKASEADISLSAEERGIGGLGIFLVKKIMDSVIYRREGDTNILTMKKNI